MASSIILRILHDQHILDIQAISSSSKLVIYTLALKKIKEGLENRSLDDVPQRNLKEYGEALNELSIAFPPLSGTLLGKKYKMKAQVIPRINSALVNALRAKLIYETEKQKNKEYLNCLIDLRAEVTEAYEFLREG